MDSILKRKVLILGGGFALIIILLLLFILNRSDSARIEKSGESGHQTAPAEQTGPIYNNFTELTSRGLTTEQLQGLQFGLFQYTESRSMDVESFTVIANSVKDTFSETESGVFVMYFDVTVNGKDLLKARLERSELTVVRLFLTDPKTSAQEYDSKAIDVFELNQKRSDYGD